MLATQTTPALATDPQNFQLRPGPQWASFEQFRIAGSGGVESVGTGQVGALRTKTGMFRVLRDEDFQTLAGLASEVRRMKGGFTTMVHAIKVVREHPASPSAVDLLLHIAAQYEGVLDMDRPFTEPETAPIPENDEVITDPAELQKRVVKR